MKIPENKLKVRKGSGNFIKYILERGGHTSTCGFYIKECSSICPHFKLHGIHKGRENEITTPISGPRLLRRSDDNSSDLYELRLTCVNPPTVFRFEESEIEGKV